MPAPSNHEKVNSPEGFRAGRLHLFANKLPGGGYVMRLKLMTYDPDSVITGFALGRDCFVAGSFCFGDWRDLDRLLLWVQHPNPAVTSHARDLLDVLHDHAYSLGIAPYEDVLEFREFLRRPTTE